MTTRKYYRVTKENDWAAKNELFTKSELLRYSKENRFRVPKVEIVSVPSNTIYFNFGTRFSTIFD